MLGKKLDELVASDIQMLVSNSAQESRSLEFKREPIGRSDDQKREFLGDVTALANTVGGDLVFGIAEDQGIAVSADGVEVDDPDAEILRIESILRSGIEPRIPSIRCQWVKVAGNRGYLVIRVQKSWAAPHRVIANAKFFGRSDRSKYPLDVAELRAAFLLSDAVTERVRQFVSLRASLIEVGDAPVPLQAGARLIIHLMPLSAFTSPQIFQVNDRTSLLRPIGSGGGFNYFHTLEGFLTYAGNIGSEGDGCFGYALAFRSGMIESCVSLGPSTTMSVNGFGIENAVISVLQSYVENLTLLGVQPPFLFSLTLTGVRGHTMESHGSFWRHQAYRMNRDVLFLPPIEWETVPTDLRLALLPTFDLLWNSFGFPGSPR